MKMKLMLITSWLLTIILGAYVIYSNDDKEILTSEEPKQIKNEGLTMMLETEVGSGEYVVSNDTTWPQDGYIFNYDLSGCENGGTLSWNSETNRVVMQTTSSDKCYVYFDKYTSVIINSVSASDISNSSITLTVDATAGENPIQTYYYSNNGGSNYIESNSNTYTFSGLETGTEYDFRIYVMDSNGVSSEIYSLQATTESAIYLANYIKSLYTSDGANGIYLHDGIGSYTNANLEAGDNSYRYSGANPNNYVCFGTDITPCPTDNLYRIIGVFGEQVKLIKHDYATSALLGTTGDYSGNIYTDWWNIESRYYKGSLEQSSLYLYYWNVNETNTWSESQLNTVNLNTNYVTSIGSKWLSKIAEHTWVVGGTVNANVYSSPVKTAHTYEVGASAADTTYNAKIGLMYTSDYGYAASPENWSTNMEDLDNDTNRNNNWMFMGLYEWTITRISDLSGQAFIVFDSGRVVNAPVYYVNAEVRASFYLNPDVAYVSGDGTISNPYRIN